ncbi:MAG: hypothetical protein IJQ43_04335 [Oscillospiraceae bacterium]|nr:hypothetical protein [Oscillospiraceae bacterium]
MQYIQNNYITVGYGLKRSYGGNQMASASSTMREVGCGVIAALDLLLYLCRFHSDSACEFFAEAAEDGCIDEKEYDELAQRLSKRFFPMIPKLGINGLMLAAGLNRFFRHYRLPYRAGWGFGSGKLFAEIEDMLARDIPVILSVGPNFPLFWQKHELSFYASRADGSFYRACGIKAHYVTVTGIDAQRLQISSWGRAYYIDRGEYMDYIRRRSGSIVSNIVKIRETKNGT